MMPAVSDTLPRIIALATALPDRDVHRDFIGWAAARIAGERERALFLRMAERSGIGHRFAVLAAPPLGPGGFYADAPPSTAARMALYAEHAPQLAYEAAIKLPDLSGITHLVVASCTGFVAPGIDQLLATRLGLAPSVERLLIGFMGCYAAVAALRSAMHIVRSESAARVLVVTVELSSLHLQDTGDIEALLAMLQFGDGAAAALVTGAGPGLSIKAPFATTLPESEALIRWTIGDSGFAMHLSGEVPGRIGAALAEPATRDALGCGDPGAVDAWAVHAGGRSILDAVERGLGIDKAGLDPSRAVLEASGNMSSATLMFVLAAMMDRPVGNGRALAFGPGLAAEGFIFRTVA